MTVRAWFTISGLVLVALVAAVVFKLFAPVSPPKILGRVDGTRLEGQLENACWPQRSEKLTCTSRSAHPQAATIPRSGRFHVVVAFPAEPQRGSILIGDELGRILESHPWGKDFAYKLDPGRYTMRAKASYPRGLYVTYAFAFRVTRSGS
jgi:hypothetical protein